MDVPLAKDFIYIGLQRNAKKRIKAEGIPEFKNLEKRTSTTDGTLVLTSEGKEERLDISVKWFSEKSEFDSLGMVSPMQAI